MCSVTPPVTCDSCPLRISLKLPCSEAEDSFKAVTSYSLTRRFIRGSHFVFPDPSLTLSLSYSHNFYFHPIHLKQFGAFHFHRIISSSQSSVSTPIDTIVSPLIPNRSYDFVLDHRHRRLRYEFAVHHRHRLLPIIVYYRPIRTLEFVYLYSTKSYIPICTRILR